jgi:hypothetical protein
MHVFGVIAVLQHRLTTEVTHLPMFSSASSNPLQAASIVPFWGYAQIVALCGVIEFVQSRVRARPGYQVRTHVNLLRVVVRGLSLTAKLVSSLCAASGSTCKPCLLAASSSVASRVGRSHYR